MKIVAILLCLTGFISGCKYIPKESVLFAESDIEAIKNITEQEIPKEDKEEFLSLFQQFTGFSFEKFLFIPEKTKLSTFEISEDKFFLFSGYIVSKSKAQELLDTLRNKTEWYGFYDYDDWINFFGSDLHQHSLDVDRYDKTLKSKRNKLDCYCFVKEDVNNSTNSNSICLLEILPTKDSKDTYSVYIRATIGREPPVGTSWSERIYN